MKNVAQENEKAISGAIKIAEREIRDHLDVLVRQSVEDTLNALLNAEADAICQASRYQRSPDRQDTRAGSYKRKLLTKAGEVELQVPRLCQRACKVAGFQACKMAEVICCFSLSCFTILQF